MVTIEAYLKFVDEALGSRELNKELKFKSFEGLVLKYGRPFELGEEPLPEGTAKECFANALHYVNDNWDLALHYVEGYAMTHISGIPLLHAWAVDENMKVLDPTWGDRGMAYYGIVFNQDWVTDHILGTGYYGVLGNDWHNDHEIMKNGFPDEALGPREAIHP